MVCVHSPVSVTSRLSGFRFHYVFISHRLRDVHPSRISSAISDMSTGHPAQVTVVLEIVPCNPRKPWAPIFVEAPFCAEAQDARTLLTFARAPFARFSQDEPSSPIDTSSHLASTRSGDSVKRPSRSRARSFCTSRLIWRAGDGSGSDPALVSLRLVCVHSTD